MKASEALFTKLSRDSVGVGRAQGKKMVKSFPTLVVKGSSSSSQVAWVDGGGGGGGGHLVDDVRYVTESRV
jgi:hypothetical protein